jgi:hypothetical protein
VETEIDNCIPFLDLKIHNLNASSVTFSIYRKPTHTDRFITNSSFHSAQHKLASFNSMCYRLVNVPLSKENYEVEKSKILSIADINGFSPKLVLNLIKKHKDKKALRDLTSLTPLNTAADENFIFSKLSFYPGLTTRLNKIFNNFNINFIPSSKNFSLKYSLRSVKDKIDSGDLSGIYQLSCQDCSNVYIGQSERAVSKRFYEHYGFWYKKKRGFSSAADHMLENKHKFSFFNLVRHVPNSKFLDAYENINIYKRSHFLTNKENPNETRSCLFDLLEKLDPPLLS